MRTPETRNGAGLQSRAAQNPNPVERTIMDDQPYTQNAHCAQGIAIANASVQAMSSREIADLTGKRHDNVMRDTRSMLLELHGEINLLKFEGVYRGANGEDRPCFFLPKRETLILVSGYNLTMRAKIIDRWAELEVQAADPMRALNDPAAMRGLLLTYTEKVIALEAANAELAPKAEALDRIAKAEGSFCITDTAKALQMRPKDLTLWLVANGWIYRRPGGGSYIGYQAKTMTGYVEHKVTTVFRSDGSEKVVEQVRITPKGLAKLSESFPPEPIAA